MLILRVIISFTKQFFTFYFIRVKCENQLFAQWDFNSLESRPPAFAASVLPLDHEGITVENEQQRYSII